MTSVDKIVATFSKVFDNHPTLHCTSANDIIPAVDGVCITYHFKGGSCDLIYESGERHVEVFMEAADGRESMCATASAEDGGAEFVESVLAFFANTA